MFSRAARRERRLSAYRPQEKTRLLKPLDRLSAVPALIVNEHDLPDFDEGKWGGAPGGAVLVEKGGSDDRNGWG
jgi:hypothetical protein